ncbi:DUF1870 family protein [Kushneria phosphatilytica]|nr:DUF1870 family protein [Kushneria phosphatilytica]OHV13024.1 hypothetical protein BH688_03210 [Kushneria phosphatilytica]
MNGKELQALRKMLMLDVSEAASHVGHVSNRTWQYWEAGRSRIPVDVEMEMEVLKQKRAERINHIEASMEGVPFEDWDKALSLKFYQRFEDYQAEHPESTLVDWRIDQAVAAWFFADGVAQLT